MTIVNSIFNWINYKRIYEIDLYREHAREIQEEVLFNLLNTAKSTEWGEKYHYGNIKCVLVNRMIRAVNPLLKKPVKVLSGDLTCLFYKIM